MANIEQSIDVHVPVRTAYDQWTQFEEFPRFMEGVEEIRQLDDKRLFWKTKIAGVTREFEAEITEQHPDHRVASELVRDACFLAGIAKFAPGLPAFRPRKVLFAVAYREDAPKPTFVVDVSGTFERKLAAVRCYGSQFDGATQAGEVLPNGEPLYDVIRFQAAHYGSLVRARYGEPFVTVETMRVEDVTALDVSTF